MSVHVCVCVWWGKNSDTSFSPPQFAFLETIVTAVTDEFPYYLRPKKAVFSGLICVAMYLMGLVLTTDVSAGRVGSWWGRQGQVPAAMSVTTRGATCFFLFGRRLAHPRLSPPEAAWPCGPESWL